MKQVMILILPTDLSPKSTSLYFAKADTGAIFFVLISDLSILLLFYYHSEIFRILVFKIGDLVSYRCAELSWVFISENLSVLFCTWNGYIWSLLLVANLRSQRCCLFQTFLFGFYNFIWGTSTFGNSDFVWVQLNARFDQCMNLVIIWFDFTNLILEIC